MTTTTPATTPDARAMPTIEALYAAGDSVKSGDEAAFEIILRGAAPGSDVSVRQLASSSSPSAASADELSCIHRESQLTTSGQLTGATLGFREPGRRV